MHLPPKYAIVLEQMKKIAVILAWFLSSTGVILGLVTMLSLVNAAPDKRVILGMNFGNTFIANSNPGLGSNAGQVEGMSTSVEASDARAQIISNFIQRNDRDHTSPLQPYDDYGKMLVTIADKYGLDFRLLPAIAMTESTLCKFIPEGTYNCTGYGITATSTLGFKSFQESFEATARGLKSNYVAKGLTNPIDIMRKYCPSSDGSWQNSVNQMLAEMRYDDRTKGLELKMNADVTQYAASPSASPTP